MKINEKDVFNNLLDIAREYVDIMESDEVTLEVAHFMDYFAKMVGIDEPISKLDDGVYSETVLDDEILSKVLYAVLPTYTKGDKNKLQLLTGMLNYVTKKRKYTPKELMDRYQEVEHENEMKKLRRFLGRTSKYSSLFEQGFSLEEVYGVYGGGYGFTDEDGVYHYAPEAAFDSEQTEMDPLVQQDLEEEFYAMAYAYAKSGRKDEIPEIIDEKLTEMRTR